MKYNLTINDFISGQTKYEAHYVTMYKLFYVKKLDGSIEQNRNY